MLCVGSINIDTCFHVKRIVREGETINAEDATQSPGGKGSNQSIAAARAGGLRLISQVSVIGTDGLWIKELLRSEGIHVEMITESSRQQTGRAIIQLSSKGENAIIVSKGSNNEVEINEEMFDNHQILLVQNEINSSATNKAMEIAYQKGLIVCMNPSPFPLSKTELNFQKVNILIMNEHEANQLIAIYDILIMNEHEANQLIAIYDYSDLLDSDLNCKMLFIIEEFPNVHMLIITLGSDGAICCIKENNSIKFINAPVTVKVDVVDTTGAGDCFTGYFISTLIEKFENEVQFKTAREYLNCLNIENVRNALKVSIIAAGKACEKVGAVASIPFMKDLMKYRE